MREEEIIDWTFKLTPTGVYYMILHFDSGKEIEYPVLESAVEQKKLVF